MNVSITINTTSHGACLHGLSFAVAGAVIALGGVCGGLIGGAVSEKIGKKFVVSTANFMVMISWIGMSFATSAWLIISIRFFKGIFCTAAYNCVRKWINEKILGQQLNINSLPFQL